MLNVAGGRRRGGLESIPIDPTEMPLKSKNTKSANLGSMSDNSFWGINPK